MKICFFLTRPDTDQMVVENGTLTYNGQTSDACAFLLNNDGIKPEEIFIPLHPSLADVCFAYLADILAKGNKLPRATARLCDFLSALPGREIPFDRASVDTLPIMHQYLIASIKDENDANRALDILFSILRQFMMDMLLFDDLDPALQPVSAKVPVAQAVKTDAEQDLDAFIKDSLRGKEFSVQLPMPDGSIQERRVLRLESPLCRCADLFARLCGFSLLITHSDRTLFYPLDCDPAAILSVISSSGAAVNAHDNCYESNELDPDAFISRLSDISCKSCKIVLTAFVKAPYSFARNKFPMTVGDDPLTVELTKQDFQQVLTISKHPDVAGKQFHYAFTQAHAVRDQLLSADLSQLLGANIEVKSATCDLYIDLPIDCMQDFHSVSIKCEGGDFALLPDGIISIWDREPPINEMRSILKSISKLELEVLKDPLRAAKVMQKATLLKISINSGKGFIREALVGCKADQRAENVLRSAQASAELLTVKRSAAIICGISAVISLILCAFPYVTGFLTPSVSLILPTVVAAVIAFVLLVVVFTKTSKKRSKDAPDQQK